MHPLCRAALLSGSSVLLLAAGGGAAAEDVRLELAGGWRIQTSAKVAATGESLSKTGADTAGWHAATVPTTVVGALVGDKTFPDPHVGMSLRQIPGTSYEVGKNFSNLPMPADSPFAVPWWYRTEFTLPPSAGGTVWLRFGGVNYRFDAWLNGRKIADAGDTAGAWRIHELDVTGVARPGRNALAVLVSAPKPNELAITFVDWNPMPPDKVMGLYRPVTVSFSGPLALRHPQVVTKLNPPALDRALLTVKAFARNAGKQPARGVLRGRIGTIAFEKPVELLAGETREVSFTPSEFAQLVLQRPRLWWPAQYGSPELYTLELEIVSGGRVSDRSTSSFGVREFTADKTPSGLVYQVNGRNILIRGAGWTPEMTLSSSAERELSEIRYVKDMGLNTIRLEGKLEDDRFFDATDREGVLVMPGWCCCDFWEKWKEWTPKDLEVATASLRDQMLRLRGRASVFTWLNGSDNPPPVQVEKAYLDVEQELGFPNPVVSSATEKKTELTGESGMKMRGPYEWVPPVYWYTDTKLGGPHGFATEIGPGPAPPPLESLQAFLPPDKLWPVNEVWNYHCGGGPFRNMDVFNAAMDARYGPSRSVEEYARKAQVAAYESHRAMLESFGARKYVATGIIQWMLNDAWPGMIWHLYDFYLRPGGSYFGAKKACEPLHVQYSYDDGSVLVVNSTLAEHRGLVVEARVVGLDGTEKASQRAVVEVGADAVTKALSLPATEGLSPAYFVFLTLQDSSGRTRSRNAYWLSARPETLAWDKSQWYYTPVAQYADLTALQQLPAAPLTVRSSYQPAGGDGRLRVVLENPSKAVAFFVHASVRRPGGEEVLPVLWDDNDVTLLPGERRELVAGFATRALGSGRPSVRVEGWNVPPVSAH